MDIAELLPAQIQSQITLPLFLHSSSAGFDSPVDEEGDGLDLNDYLIRRPASTFYARAQGDAMASEGIHDGDLLVVDRGVQPQHGDLVIAVSETEMLCRQLDLRDSCLRAGDEEIAPLALEERADLRIEGVVVHSIRQHR